ncbi:hypothetical protein FKM82_029542 [Ascaphus truei]
MKMRSYTTIKSISRCALDPTPEMPAPRVPPQKCLHVGYSALPYASGTSVEGVKVLEVAPPFITPFSPSSLYESSSPPRLSSSVSAFTSLSRKEGFLRRNAWEISSNVLPRVSGTLK